MRMGPLTPKYERQCFDAFTASANSVSMPAARMLAATIDAAGAARSFVKAFLNVLLFRQSDGNAYTLKETISLYPSYSVDQAAAESGRERLVYLQASVIVRNVGPAFAGIKIGAGDEVRPQALRSTHGWRLASRTSNVLHEASPHAGLVEKCWHSLLQQENEFLRFITFTKPGGGRAQEAYEFKQPGVEGAARGIAFARDIGNRLVHLFKARTD